jgi:uncharacterized membrane protein SpoIIM required for sporulation/uncharacterized RDD family membrane protein YckC
MKSLEQHVEIETPEQVAFSYTLAGVGSRAAAALLDYAIISGVTLGSLLALSLLWRAVFRGDISPLAKVAGAWLFALFILFFFALSWGYFVFYEALADGQTPGKRRLGLRVVQDGGYSISFAASAVRNLLRILDMQPGLAYGVGIVTAALSKSGKRLGDHLAGTMVVQEQRVALAAAAPVPALPRGEEASAALAAQLSEEEYALLERWVGRRQALDAERRTAIAAQLGARFGDRITALEGPLQARLLRLYALERSVRARGGSARGQTGAAREQNAIVATGVERWKRFAAVLDRVDRRGLRAMHEDEVGDFVAQYREVTTDLARLKTATRGRDSDALYYLSRLVARGHNLFYRRREVAARSIGRFLLISVPNEIRRSGRPILAAACLFFGPALVTYAAILRDPMLANEIVSAEMMDRAEAAVARSARGEGYVTISELSRPVIASAIIRNNVQVTFLAFAGGITAGALTVLLLVFNGIQLGAPVALFATKGAAPVIWAWIAAHGVLELSAICIAGGGGLLIASAILLPGAVTRREAMVIKGRRAIRLIAASTLFLIVAGAIEGLISPRAWPIEWKAGVALASGLLMLLYLTRGHGEAEEPAPDDAYSDARALISR